MAYNNILLQGYNKNTNQFVDFPYDLMIKSSFKVSPDKRVELKAYRDNNAELHRKTSPNHKTEVSFETYAMNETGLSRIRVWLGNCTKVVMERRVRLKVFNPETSDYVDSDFYMVDPEFTIETIKNGTVNYEKMSWNFIQY